MDTSHALEWVVFVLLILVLGWILLSKGEKGEPGGIKVIEFPSQRDYAAWLERMGKRITIVNVSTTKRWSIWTGFLGNAKTYTITYKKEGR